MVVVRRGERNTFFPTVEKLSSGELVVTYYDSPEHVSQSGRLALVRSTDGGRSWSRPRVIVDTPFDDRIAPVTAIRDGTLLASYYVWDWSTTPPRLLGTSVIRSPDRGKTWTRPVEVHSKLVGAPGGEYSVGKIVELENGDLLIPLGGKRPNTRGDVATVVRSTDGGRTWLSQTEVEIAHDPRVDFWEPTLADLGDGHLLAVLRTSERTSQFTYEVHSFDGGLTWTKPARLSFKDHRPDLLVLRNGLIFLAYGDTSGVHGTKVVVARLKRPGQAWAAAQPVVIYKGAECGDRSYPSSVQLDDGRLFTVYYDACAGYIGGTYSRASDYVSARD